MKIYRIIIPALLLLAGCEKEVDHVSETYYDIAGVYRLESMKFKELRAVDLNGDGESSEDILSELMMFDYIANSMYRVKAVVKGKGAGLGSNMAEINGSGEISMLICLQAYADWSYNDITTEWMNYEMDFTIKPNGFLSVEPYDVDGVRGEITFPMEDVMVFTINYGFYDFNTHEICREESEWRFERI